LRCVGDFAGAPPFFVSMMFAPGAGVSFEAPTDHREDGVKGAQKPKRDGKKPAQKTLKEKRQEKRNAAKGTGGIH